jgi:hypothetical protein
MPNFSTIIIIIILVKIKINKYDKIYNLCVYANSNVLCVNVINVKYYLTMNIVSKIGYYTSLKFFIHINSKRCICKHANRLLLLLTFLQKESASDSNKTYRFIKYGDSLSKGGKLNFTTSSAYSKDGNAWLLSILFSS